MTSDPRARWGAVARRRGPCGPWIQRALWAYEGDAAEPWTFGALVGAMGYSHSPGIELGYTF